MSLYLKATIFPITPSKVLISTFILLFSSYFFPLFYSLFKMPILIDRYIIFVLIPIILLVSILTFKQSTKIRNFIIILIVSVTFGNNYLEIFKRSHSKPEFNQSLSLISSTENYKIKLLSKTEINHEWLLNYLKKINFAKYKNLEFLNFNELTSDNHVWYLCYFPLNDFDCSSAEINQNYIKTIDKSFFLINVSLYEKNK